MNKQIINLAIALLFTSVSLFANASEPTIISNGERTFIVDSKIWNSESIDVSISDQFGVILYNDKQTLKTAIKYNLKNLPNGSYQVTVSNEYKTVINNITISEHGLLIDLDAKTSYKPIIDIDQNKIDINFMATSLKTVIELSSSNDVLYSYKSDDKMKINKRFDISEVPSGTYTLSVSNDNKRYTKTFIK